MFIYIEGNIGAGKTTFIEEFEKYFKRKNIENAFIKKEPVEQWLNTKDSTGKNLLEYFYEDQEKYGFAFQMNAFISRTKDILDMRKDNSTECHRKINFVERSVFTDKNVFMECNYRRGNISEIEYNIYQQWFNVFSEQFNLEGDVYIYLKTSKDICNNRIMKRDRTGESGIPLDYLEELNKLHEEWLKREEENGIKVITIDASQDFIKEPERMEAEFDRIMKVISEIPLGSLL